MKITKKSLLNPDNMFYKIEMQDYSLCCMNEKEIVLEGNIKFFIPDIEEDVVNIKFFLLKSNDIEMLEEMADSITSDVLYVIQDYLNYIGEIMGYNASILVIDDIEIYKELNNIDKAKLINKLIDSIKNPLYVLNIKTILMLIECIDVNMGSKEKCEVIEQLKKNFIPIQQTESSVTLATRL